LLHVGKLAAVCCAASAGVCDPVKDMGSETRHITVVSLFCFSPGDVPVGLLDAATSDALMVGGRGR
jgi:hypothetical protein